MLGGRKSSKTLQLAAYSFMGQYKMEWQNIMSAAILTYPSADPVSDFPEIYYQGCCSWSRKRLTIFKGGMEDEVYQWLLACER